MIKINFDKYGKIRNLDFGEEVIFKGNNRVNQIFVAFDDVAYNPNHYMTYSALINENDYEGNLTDLATAKTTIDGIEGYTFYLFSNLTAKAGELKLSVRLVDRTSERVLVSGIIPLVIEDTAISTYASVNITKTQYEALLTAFDKLSQSIDATKFKTINGESIYGEGDIVVLTGDYMEYYVNHQISNVYDSIDVISSSVVELQQSNAKLNALIEKQEKKIKQLELASEGNVLATITESDSAYEVDVGVDTLPYATIDKLGGMTYKSNNLLVLDDVAPTELNGITYSVKDGVITINGTTTATISVYLPIVNQKENVAYNLRAFFEGTKPNKTIFCYARNEAKQQLVTINNNAVYASFTPTTAIAYFNFYCDTGNTFSNFKIKPILVYGSTPASAWEKGFVGLRDSKVTEIISNGADGVISTKAIPTAIQNLDGYGIGVDSTHYNYVDFESKKFVKMIGSYTFTGSEGFGQANTNTSGVYRYFTEVLKNIAVGVKASNVKGALLMADVNTATADETYLCKDGVCIDSNGRLYFFKSDAQSATDMANYLKDKTIYFALATPVAEGLSHIIDGEILTEVESGGTLTFENEYKQDVPFTWTFQEKL